MLTALLALPFLALPGSDPFTRLELPGGARLLVLHAPEAPKQSLFAILPEGLLRDGPGQAQFSHLLEHALIRGVEPHDLQAGGIVFNGETSAAGLRLEAFAPPEQWREAATKVARFLAVRTIEEDVLAREIANIKGEVASTLSAGFTHKWAQAAWTQIVLHGRDLAEVRGDVARARPEDVAAAAAARAPLCAGTLFVAAGPVAPAEFAEFLREQLAELPVTSARPPVGEQDPAAFGDREARWDLPSRHYLEWYVLPAATEAERAAAWLFGHHVATALFSSGDPLLTGGRTLAAVHPLDDARRLLLVQAPLAGEAAALQAAVRKALDQGLRASGLERDARTASAELTRFPDLAALRKSMGTRPGAEFIEAQLALNLAQHELTSGLPLPVLHSHLDSLDAATLETSAVSLLAAARRSSLVLLPPD